MSKDKSKKPVLRVVDSSEELTSTRREEHIEYEPNNPDLREIADRVESASSVKDMFVEMYISFEDLHDCSITDKGFNLYTEDDSYLYIYTVIKKNENQ